MVLVLVLAVVVMVVVATARQAKQGRRQAGKQAGRGSMPRVSNSRASEPRRRVRASLHVRACTRRRRRNISIRRGDAGRLTPLLETPLPPRAVGVTSNVTAKPLTD